MCLCGKIPDSRETETGSTETRFDVALNRDLPNGSGVRIILETGVSIAHPLAKPNKPAYDARPRIRRWRDHSAGRSARRVTPMPWGSRPSIAALTRSLTLMRACWSGPAACGLSWPVQAACAPSGYFNTWPPIVVEFADRVGQGLEPMRLPPPSPAAGIGTIHWLNRSAASGYRGGCRRWRCAIPWG